MKPVEPHTGEGEPIVMARDQPQYIPLPARRTEEGVLTTEWQLDDLERMRVARGGRVRLVIHTFNHPLQPVRLEVTED